MQKAKVVRVFGGISQIHVCACQEFYLAIKQEVILMWFYFSKQDAIYYHFYLDYKIFPVGGKIPSSVSTYQGCLPLQCTIQ